MSIEPTLGSPLLPSSTRAGQGKSGQPNGRCAIPLNFARSVLIILGSLTILVNAVHLSSMDSELRAEIQRGTVELQARGQLETPDAVAQLYDSAATSCYVIYGIPIVVGTVFIVLALMVDSCPVPITTFGLIIYLVATAVFGFLNPQTLGPFSLAVKLVVVVALLMSVRAAAAYTKASE